MDPVTVAATSRTDRSRVIGLRVNTPASVLTHFARCFLVSPGWETTMFMLMRRYVRQKAGLTWGRAHVFRACGDSLMCPFSKGTMLPVLRCDR